MNADSVNFRDADDTIQVAEAQLGIAFIEGITRRGPVNDPSILIGSITRFRKLFGGVINTSGFPAQAERILAQGGQLRINRIAHYTTISDASTLSALPTALKNIDTAVASGQGGVATHLFTAKSKYPGADYNNMKVAILAPSNNLATNGFFNMKVYILGDEGNSTELYENLRIVGRPNIANSHFLDAVNVNSDLAIFAYLDLSGTTVDLFPIPAVYDFVSGSNGGGIVDADYMGDAGARTGLHAFDAYDDAMEVAIPDIVTGAVNNAIAAYADARGDIEGLCHLDYSHTTASGIITDRAAITTDTKYASAFYGGIIDSNGNHISEIADIINIANYVDKTFGAWFSGANYKRGSIKNAKSVVSNFGSKGQFNDLNSLARAQVNCVVAANKRVYPATGLTLQVDDSLASFRGTARLLIYLKKSLAPTLQSYLEEPPAISTFLSLYQQVEPFLDNLTNKGAFIKGAGDSKKGYDWLGDQFAANLNSLQINNIPDLNLGKYKIRFKVYPQGVITGIDIAIEISSAAGSVTITA